MVPGSRGCGCVTGSRPLPPHFRPWPPTEQWRPLCDAQSGVQLFPPVTLSALYNRGVSRTGIVLFTRGHLYVVLRLGTRPNFTGLTDVTCGPSFSITCGPYARTLRYLN